MEVVGVMIGFRAWKISKENSCNVGDLRIIITTTLYCDIMYFYLMENI
jgi:hypothetical protein